MTTQMAGKQLNSISDKIDWNNPRIHSFLFYFSIVVVWGFLLLHPFQLAHHFCLLLGCNLLPFMFSSAYFPPTLHTLFIFAALLFLSLFPPHACIHTHDQILRIIFIFPFLPSHPLFFLWDSQAKNATRTACACDMLILQKQSVTIFSPRETQSFSTDHRGFCFLKFKCSPASSSVS